jgi:hypothetical protein
MPGPIIFLDVGGVISDPVRRAAEWQRLVGGGDLDSGATPRIARLADLPAFLRTERELA